MPEQITPSGLLQDARALEVELLNSGGNAVGLIDRIRELGTKLRAARGLVLIEPNYHKAAKIYDEILMMEDVFDRLGLGETNPIFYDRNLAE